MKNKIITTMICGLLLVSLAACGDGKAPAEDKSETQETKQEDHAADSGEADQENPDASEPEAGEKDAAVPEEGEKDARPEEDFSLAMTDSYTFTDPSELEFDQRYVLVGDASCKMLSDMANSGYEVTAMYEIVYANGETPAGDFQYFVAADEENAQALEQFYESQGQAITREGNVLYAYMEGEVFQANIMMLSGMNMMSGETVEDYVDFMMQNYGLVTY